MARAKVAASGLALDVLGEEMGGGMRSRERFGAGPHDHRSNRRHGRVFARIQTFGTLMGMSRMARSLPRW